MFINSSKTIVEYRSDSKLDLFNIPKNHTLRTDYLNFINSILCIYSTSKYNDRIPVFWTQYKNDLERIPSEDSTLRHLLPGHSYYIITINNNFPIKIPAINFTDNQDYIDDCNLLSDKNKINDSIELDKDYSNIYDVILNDKNYTIDIKLNKLIPNNNYYYSIDPIYSNWPATISPSSGIINQNVTDNDNYTFGLIKSVFSYFSSGESYPNSIPYDSIDSSSNYLSNTIFSLLSLKIYDETRSNLLLTDTINIQCDNCIKNLKKKNPSINFSKTNNLNTNQNIIEINGLACSLVLDYDYLDPNQEYSINFQTINGNWPARIHPKTLNVVPNTIYEKDGVLYSKGSMICNFDFHYQYDFTQEDNINLQFYSDPYINQSFIKNNIFQHLLANIVVNESVVASNDIVIKSLSGINTNIECIDNISLSFENTTNTYPTTISVNERPGAEISVDELCCNKDHSLHVNISGMCSGDEYDYRFLSSNPLVSIAPTSGTIAFGNGMGKISTLFNLNNRPGTTVRIILTHKNSGYYLTDNVILRCPNQKPYS